MKKYRVEFEFKVADVDASDRRWHKDYLDNNGAGFTFEQAELVACDLRAGNVCYHRNVNVVEM